MLDHRNRFAEFRCSDGRLLSTGARTDDDEIVLAHGGVHVHLLLILNDAAPRPRLTRLLWDLSRSAWLSTIVDRFRLADRGFPAGNDHRDSTSLRDSRTHLIERFDNDAAAAATVADYYQLGMPRVVEQCFHRIISRDQAAHVDVGVAQLPAGQRVSPHAFGLEVHAIAPTRGRPMGGRDLRDFCGDARLTASGPWHRP